MHYHACVLIVSFLVSCLYFSLILLPTPPLYSRKTSRTLPIRKSKRWTISGNCSLTLARGSTNGCVCVCVRACVRVCVCVCMYVYFRAVRSRVAPSDEFCQACGIVRSILHKYLETVLQYTQLGAIPINVRWLTRLLREHFSDNPSATHAPPYHNTGPRRGKRNGASQACSMLAGLWLYGSGGRGGNAREAVMPF